MFRRQARRYDSFTGRTSREQEKNGLAWTILGYSALALFLAPRTAAVKRIADANGRPLQRVVRLPRAQGECQLLAQHISTL